MIPNVSFNEEFWATQPLNDFIAEAARFQWSELDATVYHDKIRKVAGIADTKKSKPKPNDTKPNPTEVTADASKSESCGTGNDTGK